MPQRQISRIDTSFHESAKIFHLRLHAAVGIMGFHAPIVDDTIRALAPLARLEDFDVSHFVAPSVRAIRIRECDRGACRQN
jgi:hypothetical protein